MTALVISVVALVVSVLALVVAAWTVRVLLAWQQARPLHLSAPTSEVTVGATDTTTAHAASGTRTVSGLVLPWDKVGQTSAGPLTIAPGATRIPTDISRLKLYSDHTGTPNHKPVGYATSWEAKPDGLYCTFAVAATADGDAALMDVREKVRDAFSAEVNVITRDNNRVTDSVMTGVALVSTPAFSDARVLEVQAAQHNSTNKESENTMDALTFMRHLIAAGSTRADARARATEVYGAEVVTAIADDQLDLTKVGDKDVDQDADKAPADKASDEGAAASAQPAHASHRAAVLPAGVQITNRAPADLSLSQAADTIRMIQSGNTSGVAHAALANITSSSMLDAAPPQWLGELWSGKAVERRIIPLLNRRDLTNWRIQGFKWTKKPMVAAYKGDKTEIPTNEVAIAPTEAEATRWAGGHDLDRKFYDFKDTEILTSYWRAMNESYSVVTDANALDFVVAQAKAVTGASNLYEALAVADAAIDDALHVAANFFIGNPADKLALLKLTAQQLPAYVDWLGVDPKKIVWSSKVPAGTLIAGAKPAVTHYELPGSPLRVEAEHLSHGGRDAALFGYTAMTLDNPDGLVKVSFASTPAPAPAPAG